MSDIFRNPVGTTPLFTLGQIVATPGALDVLQKACCPFQALLKRHVTGDWGDVCPDDATLNDLAVLEEGRLLSSYTLSSDVTVWVITEWDRSATTVLLPSEY